MKKSITYLFFFSCTILCCDLAAQAMAHSHVKLDLQEIVTINVRQPTVELDMNQVSDFQGGSSNELIGHVKVTSFPGIGYEVRVKADSDKFVGPSNDISVSTVRIVATAGGYSGTWGPDAISFNPVQLNSVGEVLLDSPSGSIAQEFNITYSIPAGQAFEYLNRTPGTYSTTVEYSVIPK